MTSTTAVKNAYFNRKPRSLPQIKTDTNNRPLWNNSHTVKNSSTPLSSLKPGETATIVAIRTEDPLHQRLLAMGFRTGKQIELIRRARFSGPLQVRIGTTDILLRQNEAQKITVHRSEAEKTMLGKS